jgi:Flp pilus assembly protein TadG
MRIFRSSSPARRRRSERGQSAAEIGILLPIFMVIILGVVEVNNALHAYITVVSASRDGARLGSKGAAPDAAIQALVAKDLSRLPNTTPPSNITISHPTIASTNAVKVEACYDHTTLLGLKLVVPKSFHMCASTTMPNLN